MGEGLCLASLLHNGARYFDPMLSAQHGDVIHVRLTERALQHVADGWRARSNARPA